MMDLTPAEIALLSESPRCPVCGHVQALHNWHCCDFCHVPGCKCVWPWYEEGVYDAAEIAEMVTAAKAAMSAAGG